VQELHIDISVSSGGLDQFLDAVPLNVEEGGMAVMQLNTTGVLSFLEEHTDLQTASAILIQLLASPQHGELRVQGDGNMTTFTQQQVDAGEVRSYTSLLVSFGYEKYLHFLMYNEGQAYRTIIPICFSRDTMLVGVTSKPMAE
jgi:hypothetical protein